MVYNRTVAFVPRGAKTVEDPVVAIERGEVAPIYCLHGAERYLVDRCLAAIRAAVLGGKAAAFAAFNQDVFDLKEASIETVVNTARTLPMMAPRRLDGTRSKMVVMSSGIMMAVPEAWITRATTSTSKPGASPASSVPAENRPMASMKTVRVDTR